MQKFSRSFSALVKKEKHVRSSLFFSFTSLNEVFTHKDFSLKFSQLFILFRSIIPSKLNFINNILCRLVLYR